MRILHISSARALGGGERHLADLVNALARRGHEVYAALAPRSPLRQELHALPEKNIITLRLLNALDIGSAIEMARLVRSRRIEIIHAHMGRDYPLAALAARRASASQLVITRHVLFPLHKLHRIMLSRVARVVAVSQAVARSLSAQGLFPPHKISVVTNGIDLNRFEEAADSASREMFRQRAVIATGRRLVGMLARSPLKGQEEFLRAAALVARRFDDVDFVIAGGDTSARVASRPHRTPHRAKLDLRGRVHLNRMARRRAPLLASRSLWFRISTRNPSASRLWKRWRAGWRSSQRRRKEHAKSCEDGATGVLGACWRCGSDGDCYHRMLDNAEKRQRIGIRAGVRRASDSVRPHGRMRRCRFFDRC